MRRDIISARVPMPGRRRGLYSALGRAERPRRARIRDAPLLHVVAPVTFTFLTKARFCKRSCFLLKLRALSGNRSAICRVFDF